MKIVKRMSEGCIAHVVRTGKINNENCVEETFRKTLICKNKDLLRGGEGRRILKCMFKNLPHR